MHLEHLHSLPGLLVKDRSTFNMLHFYDGHVINPNFKAITDHGERLNKTPFISLFLLIKSVTV